MAKKKQENTLQYLQMPLPSGGKYSRMTKLSFGGLNKRYTVDSGSLSMESNVSTMDYPYLSPSECRDEINFDYGLPKYENPICMSAFDDFIFVIYWEDYYNNDANDGEKNEVHIKLDYLTEYEGEFRRYTGLVKTYKSKDFDPVKDTEPRSIVQFNVYIQSIDIVNGQYEKKYLIFPDKASLDTNILEASSELSSWDEEELKNVSYSALYYDIDEDVYFNISKGENGNLSAQINGKKGTKDENGETVVKGYFVLDGMSVDIVEYKNDVPMKDKDGNVVNDESGKPLYPPPDSASHRHYYKNTSDVALENNPLHASYIYRWVDDEVDSENSGWKISLPPTMPDIKYATVHVSRLFGLSDDCVYASGFNDYTNWSLDTIDEYNESNAWQSKAQSNTKADGNFTGITTFQGHVICFKRDFMHEIYNTKNPFRIQDVYAEGTIDNRTIQDVDGKLIFVSEDDVKVYTGSNPRVIGYNLNMPKYEYAVSGTDNRNYYLYCEEPNGKEHLYVYDSLTDLWSEQSVDYRVISFAHNKNGMYMLCEDGCVYQMDTGKYAHDWSFETELITSQTVDIKHIKKLQMFVEHKESTESNPINMQVYILYDNESFDKMSAEEKEKRLVYDTKGKNRYGKYPIRVKPRKTANFGFKLHVEGHGYIKLYELEIFIEAGGEMYV